MELTGAACGVRSKSSCAGVEAPVSLPSTSGTPHPRDEQTGKVRVPLEQGGGAGSGRAPSGSEICSKRESHTSLSWNVHTFIRSGVGVLTHFLLVPWSDTENVRF